MRDEISEYNIKTFFSAASESALSNQMVWVPSNCFISGNEKADAIFKVGAMEDDIYDRKIACNDFFTIARQQILPSWAQKWGEGDLDG